jgi:hypothetical protein
VSISLGWLGDSDPIAHRAIVNEVIKKAGKCGATSRNIAQMVCLPSFFVIVCLGCVYHFCRYGSMCPTTVLVSQNWNAWSSKRLSSTYGKHAGLLSSRRLSNLNTFPSIQVQAFSVSVKVRPTSLHPAHSAHASRPNPAPPVRRRRHILRRPLPAHLRPPPLRNAARSSNQRPHAAPLARRVGLSTGIPRVRISDTAPVPVDTAPITGTGTDDPRTHTVYDGHRATPRFPYTRAESAWYLLIYYYYYSVDFVNI